MANRNAPNDASAMKKSEEDRWKSDSETVERADDAAAIDTGTTGSDVTRRVERNQAREEVVRRTSQERDYTPRRYEQPTEEDPVMPSPDSSLNTKI